MYALSRWITSCSAVFTGSAALIHVAVFGVAVVVNHDVTVSLHFPGLRITSAVTWPRVHSVPCPMAIPDAVAVKWEYNTDGPAGRRVIRDGATVRHLYHDICRTRLVAYAHPLEIMCPKAPGTAIYQLVFSRRSTTLIRVSEKDEGCRWLSVDGRADLGSALMVFYLPPGVPRFGPR